MRSDSFEELEVHHRPPYHLLLHSYCGSITASISNQWCDYLFSKLQKYNLNLRLDGKNKYFI